MAVLLSCAATVKGREAESNANTPMIDVPENGVVQVSSEGFLEERLVMPATVSSRLMNVAMGESLKLTDWPVMPGDRRDIRITRVSLYAPGAKIFEIGERGVRQVPRSKHRHFIGQIEGDQGSGVLIVLDPDSRGLTGLVVADDLSYDMAPVVGGNPTKLRVVATHERVADFDPFWDCGGTSLEAPLSVSRLTVTPKTGTFTKAGGPLEAVLAIDTDTELMSQKFGGSTSAATDYIADLIAAMNVMYTRDLGVTLVQGTTFLRTSSDPYTSNSGGSASPTELYEFRNYWSSNYGSVQRALAAMLSGKSPRSNSASGIAFVGGLCSTSSGYSFSKVFKADYLSGDAKLVGHEIGHNFGSPHTHCYNPPIDTCYSGGGSGCYNGTTSCPGGPGSVMSYCHITGCGSTLDFHPTAVNHILNNYVSPATGVCLFEAAAADGIFTDDFEGGGTGAWSSTSQ
jgi:hypothetical protein